MPHPPRRHPPLVMEHRRPLDLTEPAPHGQRHLSAASGLLRLGSVHVVIADDDLALGIFPIQGATPGRRERLLPGTLPLDPRERKKRKPDFEAIACLSREAEAFPLLILGSGSTAHREVGIFVTVDPEGDLTTNPRPLDLSPLYRALSQALGTSLNIEGAVVTADRLVLLQRGNGEGLFNALIDLDLSRVRTQVQRGEALGPDLLLGVKAVDLGHTGGVPYTLTDGVGLADGRLLVSAAAEATADPYADGACLGSILAVLANGEVSDLYPLQPVVKVEGLALCEGGPALAVEAVTDADDPSMAASLYRIELQDFG